MFTSISNDFNYNYSELWKYKKYAFGRIRIIKTNFNSLE